MLLEPIRCLRDGPTRASTLLYLTPGATALWAAATFGQPLRPATVLGLLVSASAVLLLRTAPGAAPRRKPLSARRTPA